MIKLIPILKEIKLVSKVYYYEVREEYSDDDGISEDILIYLPIGNRAWRLENSSGDVWINLLTEYKGENDNEYWKLLKRFLDENGIDYIISGNIREEITIYIKKQIKFTLVRKND